MAPSPAEKPAYKLAEWKVSISPDDNYVSYTARFPNTEEGRSNAGRLSVNLMHSQVTARKAGVFPDGDGDYVTVNIGRFTERDGCTHGDNMERFEQTIGKYLNSELLGAGQWVRAQETPHHDPSNGMFPPSKEGAATRKYP